MVIPYYIMYMVIWSKNAALCFFEIEGDKGSFWEHNGTPSFNSETPREHMNALIYQKKQRAAFLDHIIRTYHANFGVNWTNSCIEEKT